ncbi:kinase-like domain-containing protein [Mycena leptocephala]|nr:kinase-like domain-containing protein [Mycena leptocephala]
MTTSLYEEARIWKSLEHPNILPFLGIALDLGLSPALVSPLCTAGPIMKYIQQNIKDPKEKLQMKKVLVDGDGVPVICGYGMAKALRQPANTTSLFSSPIRFAAPESFTVDAGPSAVRTPAGDVYAFSMVTFEILSSFEPYHHLPTEHAVFLHILRGDRPIRTHLDQEAVTNRIWRLLTLLWDQNPYSRPAMSNVMSSLIRMYAIPPLIPPFQILMVEISRVV